MNNHIIYRVGDVWFKELYPEGRQVPSCRITVGKYSYSGEGDNAIGLFAPSPTQTLTIGRYCSIGLRLDLVLTNEHRMHTMANYGVREAFLEDHSKTVYKDLAIGNDVWIGNDVTMLGGAKIGDGVIVGTKSLVTSNQVLEDFGIYVGVPAKLLRFRFDEETRRNLSNARWWDMDREEVIADITRLEATLRE